MLEGVFSSWCLVHSNVIQWNPVNATVPWVPEVFSRVRRGASFRRPQADTCSAEGRRHERRSFSRGSLFKT